MFDKTYIGRNLSRIETAPAFAPFSKVTAWYDDKHAFTAGDDTGRTLEVDLPFATQAIVDGMLERIRGYEYQPWYGFSSILDPAAELGDGVNVNGLYSVLASVETVFDGLMISDAAAPEDEEVDHEYQFASHTTRALRRKMTLGADYHGVSITQAKGLEVTQYAADGSAHSRAQLNGDVFAMYDDNGTPRIYFDPETGRYKFVGDLDITGGSINMSGGSIKWGKDNNPAAGKMDYDDTFSLITSELISGPTIAGGQFMDLAQRSWLEMGNSADGKIAYVNHYYDGYSPDDPVMVMGYTNPTGLTPQWVLAPFFNIAMTYMNANSTMYANGKWDFSQATVTGLDGLSGEDCYIEAEDDVVISAGPVVVRFDAGNERINFWFADSGVGWYLSANGLEQA